MEELVCSDEIVGQKDASELSVAGGLVQDFLFSAANRWPNKEAVRDGRLALTYGELASLSHRIAHALRACGVRRGDRVLLLMQRSPSCLTAMSGILEADGAYVPLDAKSPAERWRKIASDCQPAAVLCDAGTVGRIREHLCRDLPVMCLSCGQDVPEGEKGGILFIEDLARFPETAPCPANTPQDLAYVLYTSGSTGDPKGVMITHGNIRNYIEWALGFFSMNPQDRVLGTAPFHFDMSTFDIWATMAAGATLCLAGEPLTLFPEKLVRYMEEERVTLWKGISSLLMYVARAGVLRQGRMPELNRVLFGGEALPTKYLMQWMEHFPEKAFYNVYGPTEATGISMVQPILRAPENPEEKIPIGKACRGARIYLLDEFLNPVQKGEIGELFIAGPGVGAGYLNDAQKTARAFFPNPLTGNSEDRWYRTGDLAVMRADGTCEFVGRRDHQVKIMGYRIELPEIEHALLSLPGVKDGAVICSPTPEGTQALIGFYEAEDSVDSRDLLSGLKERLPAYMVPRRLVALDKIPRGDRGKTDRRRLLDLLGKVSP